MLRLARGERSAILASLSYALATGALSLAVPLAAQALLQNVAFSGLLQPVVVLALIVCAGLLLAGFLSAAQKWLIEIVARRLFLKVTLRFAERLGRQDGARPLANRFFDVVGVEKTAASLLIDGPAALLQLAVGMSLLAIYHPLFLGLALALLAVLGVVFFLLGRGAASTAVAESTAKYEVAEWLEEIADNPGVFDELHGRRYAETRAERLGRAWLDRRRTHFRHVFIQAVGLIAVSGTLTALLLGVGGALVVQGELTLGQLVAAELVAAIAAAAMTRLAKLIGKIYDLGASLEKIAQVSEIYGEGDDTNPVQNPGFLVRPARWILGVFAVSAVGLTFVPWQQTSPGSGEVTAFAPAEREQEIHAPVSGRVERWSVVEGQRVEAGQLLVEIVDVDPGYLERLERQRTAVASRIEAAEMQAEAYEAKAEALRVARARHLESQDLKIEAARQKLGAAEQMLAATEASLKAAELNEVRRQGLVGEGLVSRRDLELAEMSATKARADVNQKRAYVAEARADVSAAQAERLRKASDDDAKIASANADARKARAEVAKAKEALAKAEVSLARQGAQRVTAPVAGSVLWVNGHLGGNIVKAGDNLVRIVPDTDELSVELWVDGNDAPLIFPGEKVRVQIEGWPAVQVAGWPNLAVGTFGGEVAFVDARSRANGRFRVFVRPDPSEPPWPASGVLRQGARAKGWVLLRQVPLGFELWRQINGFPVGLPPGGSLELGKETK